MSELIGYYLNEEIYEDDHRLSELITKIEFLPVDAVGESPIRRCDYCGNLLESEILKCPYCGGQQ